MLTQFNEKLKESSLTGTEKALELEILRAEHLKRLALNGMFVLGEGEEGEVPGQIRLDGSKSSLSAWWYGITLTYLQWVRLKCSGEF